MSRAFVKEQEGDAIVEDLPERPQSPHPNYVTPSGLAKLETQRTALIEQRKTLLKESEEDIAKAEMLRHVERDLRYLDGRIERAILVDLSHQPQNEVAFGATVNVVDENGQRHSFQIVGEDEANASVGRVSWVSPLARALIGARIGGVVTWERPAGDRVLRVTSIKYLPGDAAPRPAPAGLAPKSQRPLSPDQMKSSNKPAPKLKSAAKKVKAKKTASKPAPKTKKKAAPKSKPRAKAKSKAKKR
jgi:transcription elongation GreA/GreB family factor